ncbi:MAG: ATP-binding cassette domain-containing protein [Proteobacteria bacterium]|nr:ATP-binding cassette domain-containing protein [Pseudomonadota bacterium]
MNSAPHFALRDVERRWGKRIALVGIDLTIEPGERIALIGPSGSGKTTLLRLLMAALRPTGGVIDVDGAALAYMTPAQIRAHRRRCGLVDQDSLLIPRLSVHDNVIAGRVASWPWWRVLASTVWSFERERVRVLLANVGLADRQWDRADQLSGGQQQRVSIARALAGDQSVLLADEPTAALDPNTSAEVIGLLAREIRRRDATLIVSTHRVSQVIGEVDRVVGLREGRIFFDRPASETGDAILDELYEGSRERA